MVRGIAPGAVCPSGANAWREMEQDIDLYVALSHPEDSLWEEGQRPYVRQLRMYSVSQPWPLLLAAHRAYPAHGFTEILRACSIISLRYNVISGLITNEQERTYNSVAQRIAAGEVSSPAQAIRALAPIYVNDSSANRDLGNRSFAEKRPVYEGSRFAITQRVAQENHDWNLDRLAERQRWLARQATAIWRISQLG